MSTMPFATKAADHVDPAPPVDCPLRFGTPEDFARVRSLLAGAGYNDRSLCRAFEIPDIADIVRVDWDKAPLEALSAELRLCVSLFLRAQSVPKTQAAAVWGAETLQAFLSLGLLRPSKRDADHAVPTVWLTPVDGFVVAADLAFDPDGDHLEPFDDVVFPATEAVTLEFLHFLPDVRGGEALDLCGGTGIGALRLARTARVAVTADLTPRSAFFAAFNGRLNDSRIVSRCGDLYGPVSGQQFDVIAAHPPYVPDIGQFMIYRDGGESGEAITRGVIEGVPKHLRVGGTAVIVGFARDTNTQQFEQRAREWLGEAAAEFDVIFGMDRTRSIEQIAEGQRRRLRSDADAALRRLQERLRELDTRQFVHGALYLRRSAAPVTTPPLRIRITSKATPADFERMFAWRERRRQPGFQDWLAGARPSLAPHVEMHTRQVVKDDEFVVSEIMFRIDREFDAALRPDVWVVPMLCQLNGRRSVAEVFSAAHVAGELPKGFSLEAFAGLVDLMIERGYLRLDLPHSS